MLYVALVVYLSSASAEGLRRGGMECAPPYDPAEFLKGFRCELTSAGMKAILDEPDSPALQFCFEYIAEQRFVELVPNVRRRFGLLDLGKRLDVGPWCAATKCLLRIDNEVPPGELEKDLTLCRNMAFKPGQDSNTRNKIYEVFLAAHRYKEIDVKQDMLRFAKMQDLTHILGVFLDLFALYGNALTDPELLDLVDSWKDKPSTQATIIGFAHERALLLGVPEKDQEPQTKLAERGFGTTEDDMRKVLAEGKPDLLRSCLTTMMARQYVNLIPDLKRYIERLNEEDEWERLNKFWSMEYLFALEPKMSATEVNTYLEEIRTTLFKPGFNDAYYVAFRALLAAHRYQVADIKSDLLRLATPDDDSISSARVVEQTVIPELFSIIRESLTEEEERELREHWKDHGGVLRIIDREAPYRSQAIKAAPSQMTALSQAQPAARKNERVQAAPLRRLYAAGLAFLLLASIIALYAMWRRTMRPRK